MLWLVPCAFSSTYNFAHAQALYQMSSLCRSYECMNIARVNIGVLAGWKKIKLRRISFVLGYLRMIFQLQLHRILATFNIKIIIWQPVYWTTSNIHIWTSAIYILSVACKYKDILHDYFPLKLIGKYLLLYNNIVYWYHCISYSLYY